MRQSVTVFLVAMSILAGPWAVGSERVYAQDRDGQGRPAHSLNAGVWALQFGVGDDAEIDSFLGSTLSGKRHTSAARAWEFGLTLDASARTGGEEGGPEDRNQEAVALTAHYLAYPLLGSQDLETVQLFVGAGPRFSVRRESTGGGFQTSTDWGIGLSGTIGAEWFIHRRVSLVGAYDSALMYRRQHSGTDSAPGAGDSSANLYSLDAGGVHFGVSVYF